MPFKKVASNKYKSPSGRSFTKKQVELYYATDGFKKKPKSKLANYGK
jgi:hypothetical protein